MSDVADHIVGPNAQFLRKTYLVKTLFTKMNPFLAFTGLFPAVPTDSRAVLKTKDQYSASTDPAKKFPAPLTEGADWPSVSVTLMTQDSAMLQKDGLEVRFGEDVLTQAEGFNAIDRTMNRVGYWFAQFLNTRMSTGLVAGGTALGAGWAPKAVWSDEANNDPFTDLVKFKACMRRVDSPYVCTDYYVCSENYNELELYLLNVNADMARRAIIGTTVAGRDSIYIPGLDGTVHRVDDGIAESRIVGLDGSNPCGTYYYFQDPKYTVGKVSYPIRDAGGNVVQKTTQGLGLNSHQYFDDNKMQIVTKLWFDSTFVVEDEYGAITDTGI
jgi:hypothetical protein